MDVDKAMKWFAVPAALAAAIVAWKVVGWMTPEQHAEDVARIEAEHDIATTTVLEEVQKVSKAVQENRDEWWCDEQDEYLDDLLAKKDSGDTTAALNQEIMEQRAKMADISCHRFDKD